ncbi:hypothetical protein EYZ11_001247 [Aspergillus tanneri]|uniref:Uncharacterized protein n=1 Tax=Aspergillus tanneri TaxID=1220188 RepID=A0A4S3JV09_9EURO|nr:hypothetical protein EYZ11_001247 [Aspergillus tanneri]
MHHMRPQFLQNRSSPTLDAVALAPVTSTPPTQPSAQRQWQRPLNAGDPFRHLASFCDRQPGPIPSVSRIQRCKLLACPVGQSLCGSKIRRVVVVVYFAANSSAPMAIPR